MRPSATAKIIEVPLGPLHGHLNSQTPGYNKLLSIYRGLVLIHSSLRAGPMRHISYNGAVSLWHSQPQSAPQKCVVHRRKRVRAKHRSNSRLQGCHVPPLCSNALQQPILSARWLVIVESCSIPNIYFFPPAGSVGGASSNSASCF